jgi:hypothetical protein
MRVAAHRMVSPSGTERQAPWPLLKSVRTQLGREHGAERGLAVDLLQGELARRPAPGTNVLGKRLERYREARLPPGSVLALRLVG